MLLSQGKDCSENKESQNIVILPSPLSSTAADSETQKEPQDKLGEENYLFEHSGGLEVEYEHSSHAVSDNLDEEPVQPSKRRRRKHQNGKNPPTLSMM